MKIAVFYPAGYTAWSITKGVCDTFSRMGHEVTDCGADYTGPLNHHLVFVSGPEYLWRRLREVYPEWDALPMPRVGWLHETVEREDYATNSIAIDGKLPIEEIKKLTPSLFTPATQDRKYGLQFLPFGVDTKKFFPRDKDSGGKLYTGSLYKKRKDVLSMYPEIRTLAAYRDYETVEEYAKGIGDAEIVLNLPSLSEASNTRTFEVLASRTALITPAMAYPDALFEHGKHLLYYKGSPALAFEEAKSIFREIAWQGYEEVLKKHTIKHRLEEVLVSIHRPVRFHRSR